MKTFVTTGLIAGLLALGVGCGGSSESKLSKDDAAKKAKADASTDYCEENGWYGDGVCDTFCTNPDPDCDDEVIPDSGCKTDEECFTRAGAYCFIMHHTWPNNGQQYTEGTCMLPGNGWCTTDAQCSPMQKCSPDCGMMKCGGSCRAFDGCQSDADCTNGDGCYVHCSNVEGTCNGECRAKNGGICNVDADCPDGQTCMGSCGAGSCWGECRDLGVNGCQTDADCRSDIGAFCWLMSYTNPDNGEVHNEGTCMLRTGDYCTNDSHCNAGNYCRMEAGMMKAAGMCAPFPGDCQQDSECPTGQMCVAHCPTDPSYNCTTECREVGQFCVIDADCESPKVCRVTYAAGSSYGECRDDSSSETSAK